MFVVVVAVYPPVLSGEEHCCMVAVVEGFRMRREGCRNHSHRCLWKEGLLAEAGYNLEQPHVVDLEDQVDLGCCLRRDRLG